jgi:hypothetical protein
VPRSQPPGWLTRIEMLGTTITVLLVGGMMIWYEALEQGPRLAVTIGSAAVLYVAGLAIAGLRSDPHRISWWPFALAGVAAGAAAELINAQFMVTRELLLAAVTGVVIGTAHWTALWIWIRLDARRPA